MTLFSRDKSTLLAGPTILKKFNFFQILYQISISQFTETFLFSYASSSTLQPRHSSHWVVVSNLHSFEACELVRSASISSAYPLIYKCPDPGDNFTDPNSTLLIRPHFLIRSNFYSVGVSSLLIAECSKTKGRCILSEILLSKNLVTKLAKLIFFFFEWCNSARKTATKNWAQNVCPEAYLFKGLFGNKGGLKSKHSRKEKLLEIKHRHRRNVTSHHSF